MNRHIEDGALIAHCVNNRLVNFAIFDEGVFVKILFNDFSFTKLEKKYNSLSAFCKEYYVEHRPDRTPQNMVLDMPIMGKITIS